jgi:hypothetical protein
LDHVSYALGAVRVVADVQCRLPGAPNPKTDPAFAGVFQQLLQNAEQFQLLADSFPYASIMQRVRQSQRGDGVITPIRTDTVETRSDKPGWRYKAGDVVYNSWLTGERAMHLPRLSDFASREFINSHCFTFGGRETADGRTVVRINFRVAERIGNTDVNGAILLDSSSYQIRRAELVLSKIPRWLNKTAEVRVTTLFYEVTPGVLVFSEVRGLNTFKPSKSLLDDVEDREDQRLLDFFWLRADPRIGAPATPQKP